MKYRIYKMNKTKLILSMMKILLKSMMIIFKVINNRQMMHNNKQYKPIKYNKRIKNK